MNRPRQRNGMVVQVFYHSGKNILFFAFSVDVFITRNDPFCPTIWSFCIISAFYSRKIQTFGKPFPWLERVRKI